MKVLGVPAPPELTAQWAGWLAPGQQPFLLTQEQIGAWELTAGQGSDDPQLRDTYETWRQPPGHQEVWLSEAEFAALPHVVRAGLVREQARIDRGAVPSVRAWRAVLGPQIARQADGYRFVWWPSLLAGAEQQILARVVAAGQPASHHADVAPATWAAAGALLPCARELAGTFPAGSGPNCFGTVMAAAGVAGAAGEWMQREPFEEWLRTATVRVAARRPSRSLDRQPGTVLVWRSAADGSVQHAAVTLGDDWALNKPSQGWMTPRIVLPVAEAILSSRDRGLRLARYTLPVGRS